jgi:hypothetical protein
MICLKIPYGVAVGISVGNCVGVSVGMGGGVDVSVGIAVAGIVVGGGCVAVGVIVGSEVGVGIFSVIVTRRSAKLSSPLERYSRSVTLLSVIPCKFHVWIREGFGNAFVPCASIFH